MCKQLRGPHKAPDVPLAGGWAPAETRRSVSVMCVQSQLVSDHCTLLPWLWQCLLPGRVPGGCGGQGGGLVSTYAPGGRN